MKDGEVEAVVVDEFVAKIITDEDDSLIAEELSYKDGEIAPEDYGIVVPKDNPELLSAINEVVDEIIAENKINEWVTKYLE
jgi:ABC-type amino acid transport substrate-binding protein